MEVRPKPNLTGLTPDASVMRSDKNRIDKVNLGDKVDSIQEEILPDASGKDYNVSLSPEARKLTEGHKKAFKLAKDTSPIREEKVQKIKERIKNGTYQVDSGKIADGMLNEAIKDKLATS